MIKYLVKFVKEDNHAELLLDGVLYMRSASFYHSLELGQGDIREAAVFDNLCIYKNNDLPIYCMYSIDESEIKNGMVLIPERCVREFGCENGYIVLVDFVHFKPMLANIQTYGYQLNAGRVSYHRISFEESKKLFCGDSVENLFIKHPYFSHQKEYRIVIAKSMHLPGKVVPDHVEYRFSSDLKSIACKIKISKLTKEDENYKLNVEGILKSLS